MSGAIPPLPQYAFMASSSVKSTGTTLSLRLSLLEISEDKHEKLGRSSLYPCRDSNRVPPDHESDLFCENQTSTNDFECTAV
jgi:hypothetical protein